MKNFDYCLIVPLYKEKENILNLLGSIKLNKKNKTIIIILNINLPSDYNPIDYQNNLDTINLIKNNYPEVSLGFEHPFGLIHILNQQQNIIPKKQGVGLARKQACDYAIELYKNNRIKHPWLYNTDGDVILPNNYFERIEESFNKNISACIYPYKHQAHANPQHNFAINLYQQKLDQYLSGLIYAKSPYAFYTIGSTIAIHMDYYQKVRGFPKRPAGEDFYMLNKLAKIGKIKNLSGEPILLSNRLSTRVPFGTGQSVKNIIETKNYNIFYKPISFEYLKIFLSSIKKINLTHSEQTIKNIINNKNINFILENLKFFENIKKIQNNSNTKNFHGQIHNWFDGLKTLRFIHEVEKITSNENQTAHLIE